jgi:NAD+ kinase
MTDPVVGVVDAGGRSSDAASQPRRGGDGRDAPAAAAVADQVEATGATAVRGSVDDLLDRSVAVLVAPGDRAVSAVATCAPATPVLPVAAGAGVQSVPESALADALTGALDGQCDHRERDVLSVAVGGERVGRAAFDLMLVTRDPAKISEYALRSAGREITQVRADGIVMATPAGSDGYAADAGGPTLAPGTGIAVVPVAPFATDRNHWVVDPSEGLTATVERDEGPVELLVDDQRHGVVPPNEPVAVAVDGRLRIIVGAESRSYWE